MTPTHDQYTFKLDEQGKVVFDVVQGITFWDNFVWADEPIRAGESAFHGAKTLVIPFLVEYMDSTGNLQRLQLGLPIPVAKRFVVDVSSLLERFAQPTDDDPLPH